MGYAMYVAINVCSEEFLAHAYSGELLSSTRRQFFLMRDNYVVNMGIAGRAKERAQSDSDKAIEGTEEKSLHDTKKSISDREAST